MLFLSSEKLTIMDIEKIKLKEYPTQIVRPFNAYQNAEEESSMHKSLLDIGESLLTYIVGIMFGEYKKSGEINEKLESEFYKYSSRKPSFGVFLSFMRLMSKELKETILIDKFDRKYELVSDFVFEFELLKQVINEGADADFFVKVESLRKGRSAGKKGLIDFFDSFIMIRNIYAHPDEKAGPKDKKRTWPMIDEYYTFINTHMSLALAELMDDFDFLKSYRPMVAKIIDDKSKKAKFMLEVGDKEKELELDLSIEDLRFINSDIRYLMDPSDKLFVKFYYHSIPQLNPAIAKKIIDKEKAKAMEPHLIDMIQGKLSNNGKIDELEYLILRDTAKTSSISIERLFQLLEKVKTSLKIEGTIGTPNNKGDIFIESKDDKTTFSFNPWWLHYLSMVPKIDKNTVKEEKSNEKKLGNQIKSLKQTKKSLSISKRLESAEKKLKDKKTQKSKQIKLLNNQLQKKLSISKKTNDDERKATLLDEIEGIKIRLEEKKDFFDNQIEELIQNLENISLDKDEKVKEIDDKIIKVTNELDEYSTFTQWGMHKNLWEEINQYVEYLLEVNLNTEIESDNFDSETSTKWINSPNSWQIGNLAFTYWAKIHLADSPLGMTYNVGYAVSSRFKWLPKNIDESLVDSLKKPSSIMWTTQDDQWVAKIDLDGSLGKKKAELNAALVEQYQKELIDLGANLRCTPVGADGTDDDQHFMPLKKYLEVQDDFEVESVYSRVWPVDAFYKKGKIMFDVINQYEREMVAMLQLFSNVIIQLNDYALSIGINQETIGERFDQYNRLKETMFNEFEKKFPVGTLFRPSKEDDLIWRKFASHELGLSDYLYEMMASTFRFSSVYNAREYIKIQRDKYKLGSKEYEDWNQKLKEI